MNRKWVVVGALAAVLAIVLGARLGHDLLTQDPAAKPAKPAKPAAPTVKRFHETVSDISLSFPASWTQLPSPDPEVPLLAVAPGRTAVLQLRRSATGLEEDITRDTLPIAKRLTDPLFAAIKHTKLIEPAKAVEMGGLVGWRYRYTVDGDQRARDHYFLFKGRFLLSMVFEVKPASRLQAVTPQFDRIASSVHNGPPQ
ncbi:MAG: hypothetical protein QOG15_2519 [Solirubrobacteraceae bacterium]|nr:hypothetical protein [Solirubrobacteraceae bacterium]